MSTEPREAMSMTGHNERVKKRRRNRQPCFACASKRTRCTPVAVGLCEKCRNNGRSTCLPHVPWQETLRAATQYGSIPHFPSQITSSSNTGPALLQVAPGHPPQTSVNCGQYNFSATALQHGYPVSSPNTMSVDIHRVGFYSPEVPQTHMASQQGIYASVPPMNSNMPSQSNEYLQQLYPSPGLCTPPSSWASTSSNSDSSDANSLSPTLSGYYSPSDYAASMRPYDYAPGANIGELPPEITYGSMY